MKGGIKDCCMLSSIESMLGMMMLLGLADTLGRRSQGIEAVERASCIV